MYLLPSFLNNSLDFFKFYNFAIILSNAISMCSALVLNNHTLKRVFWFGFTFFDLTLFQLKISYRGCSC